MGQRLISNDEILADELEDPEFRAYWGRTALPRWLAVEISRYRSERNLSQTQLAAKLGMKQPAIARLEGGESMPTLPMLMRLSRGLDLELMIDIRPHGVEAKLPRKGARRAMSFSADGADVLVATA